MAFDADPNTGVAVYDSNNGGWLQVGGTSLGAPAWAGLIAIVNQGIYYTNFSPDWASLILGILLLAAVLMNNTFRKLALSSLPGTRKKA